MAGHSLPPELTAHHPRVGEGASPFDTVGLEASVRQLPTLASTRRRRSDRVHGMPLIGLLLDAILAVALWALLGFTIRMLCIG